MLQSIDSFFTRVITESDFFTIDFDRQFPPGSVIHATTSLSSIRSLGPNPLAIAWIVSFSIHLTGGGEGPRVFLPEQLHNSITVGNCARIQFRLAAGRADAKSLINIFTL